MHNEIPSFVIVCEARADFEIASTLADRVLREKIEWIRDNDSIELDNIRRWRSFSFDTQHTFIKWSGWQNLVPTNRQIKAHGKFEGLEDFPMARKILLLLNNETSKPKGVFFIRDSDNRKERKQGLEQVRSLPWPFTIIIGIAHSKRECWVLNGFEPTSDTEKETIQKLCKELTFHPCEQSEKLNALQMTENRNSKRVLDILTDDNYQREQECWTKTTIETLKMKGTETGLTDYIQELETTFVSCFT